MPELLAAAGNNRVSIHEIINCCLAAIKQENAELVAKKDELKELAKKLKD